MTVRVYASEKPRFDIHTLPVDAWEKITGFWDLRQIQEMHGVCKAFNHVFVELAQIQIKMRLKETPATILLEKSSMLKDAPIPRLHRLIRAAYKGTIGQELLAITPLKDETSLAGYQSLPIRFRFDHLTIWDFMGSALAREDQGLIEYFVQRALMGGARPVMVDCLATHYLEKNKFDVFKQLLLYTSVYVQDKSDPLYFYRNSPLEDFLREAAKKDLGLFEYLLSLNKLSWVQGRALLSVLVQDHQIEAIKLLRKYISYLTFIPK